MMHWGMVQPVHGLTCAVSYGGGNNVHMTVNKEMQANQPGANGNWTHRCSGNNKGPLQQLA